MNRDPRQPYRCGIFMREGVRMKRCSGCQLEKPLTDFTKGTGPGGYSRHCRQCHKDYRERRRAQVPAVVGIINAVALSVPVWAVLAWWWAA
jgi:hypothetical protein